VKELIAAVIAAVIVASIVASIGTAARGSDSRRTQVLNRGRMAMQDRAVIVPADRRASQAWS